MNIPKVAKIIKHRKVLHMIKDENGLLWVGDGRAFYQLEGIPEVTAAALLKIMGVDDPRKWRALGMHWPEGLNMHDEKLPVKHAYVPMKHYGDDYMPIVYENAEEMNDIIWILAAYMKPLEKLLDVQGFVQVLPNGDRCVVFKSGFFPVAFIGEDALCRDEAFVNGLRVVSTLSMMRNTKIADMEKIDGPVENHTFDFGPVEPLELEGAEHCEAEK